MGWLRPRDRSYATRLLLVVFSSDHTGKKKPGSYRHIEKRVEKRFEVSQKNLTRSLTLKSQSLPFYQLQVKLMFISLLQKKMALERARGIVKSAKAPSMTRISFLINERAKKLPFLSWLKRGRKKTRACVLVSSHINLSLTPSSPPPVA